MFNKILIIKPCVSTKFASWFYATNCATIMCMCMWSNIDTTATGMSWVNMAKTASGILCDSVHVLACVEACARASLLSGAPTCRYMYN